MAAASIILGITTPFHSPLKMQNRFSSKYPRYAEKLGRNDVVIKSVLMTSPPCNSSSSNRSLRLERAEVFKSMEKWAEENILVLLKPVEKSWQPHDLLPNPASEGFYDELTELKERAKELPDEFFVALVGDMVTEEALPTYQSVVGAAEGFIDETGADLTPFQAWNRGWSAEENRHGDLLNKYLYLSGRVDMRQVEKTTHYLIKSGMDVGGKRDPYLSTIYTSFQERATFISHRRTASLAKEHGDPKLAQICGAIASDEKRHEIAYTNIVDKFFELDPTGAMLALEEMMKRGIKMPGHLMFDGRDPNLFLNYADVASGLGVYSWTDYIDVTEHLVEMLNIEKLTGLSGEGRRAQDYVCGLPKRFRRVQERLQDQNAIKEATKVKFSWLFDRLV